MKKILLIAILITGVCYAGNCADYKRKAAKYEQMAMSASNMDISAKYIKMSIDNKKKSMNSCFMSGADKEKMYADIKDMKEMKKNLRNESSRKRQHEMNIARERSNITIRIKNDIPSKSSRQKKDEEKKGSKMTFQ